MPEAISQEVCGIRARSSGLTGPQTNVTSPSASQLDAAKDEIEINQPIKKLDKISNRIRMTPTLEFNLHVRREG